ncbi:hypothetical protein SAMN05216591_0236 [Pseudomonas extremaustralis]|uniref:Uncharacterized protein n=1 Tax=Pseudomonas extremaustralis TaxID=359110 RepID=A0ABY0MV99_9PSED|nr:hypothetical protein SAMN05216591_0236 [Pseudomonas extremaustralis]
MTDVGGGLLPIAAVQSHMYRLISRYWEQAHT